MKRKFKYAVFENDSGCIWMDKLTEQEAEIIATEKWRAKNLWRVFDTKKEAKEFALEQINSTILMMKRSKESVCKT